MYMMVVTRPPDAFFSARDAAIMLSSAVDVRFACGPWYLGVALHCERVVDISDKETCEQWAYNCAGPHPTA